MESNDLAFFLIYETVLLLVLGFSIKRRLTTLDISQHGLATEFLIQRPDLNSTRLKPLCPHFVSSSWKRLSVFADLGFVFLISAFFGLLRFTEVWNEKTDLSPMSGFSMIFLFFIASFGFQTTKNFLNRRRFQNGIIVFGDGADRWISELEKSSPTFKLLVIPLGSVLFLAFFIFAINDLENPAEIVHNCLLLLFFAVMFLYSFRSEQTALGTPGLFDRGSFVPWSKIPEYRWFQDRSALLLIVDRWSTKSPVVIFPVQESQREDIDNLLTTHLPDKQREDVEPALEKLDSSESPLAETSPA
jgi:hypothetical protein